MINGNAIQDEALGAAIQGAARDLPEGWQIQITIEKGAGWARLYNSEGIRVDDFDSTDLGLQESIVRGIGMAVRAAEKTGGSENGENN